MYGSQLNTPANRSSYPNFLFFSNSTCENRSAKPWYFSPPYSAKPSS